MHKKPPFHQQTLESSSTSILIALSETEVGKVILPNNLVFVEVHTGKTVDFLNDPPKFEKEMAALRYANAINDLMPKFIRKQLWQTEGGEALDMLVMERLYPLPIHHFDCQVRKEMIGQFEEKLEELHKNLFVHGDLMRPTNFFNRGDKEWMFRNIVQTESGLRLIDAGFGTIANKGNISLFASILIRERDEIKCFREYYLE